MRIEIERSYDILDQVKAAPRYLVDRLWPRGIKKENLQLDLWIKELSPSNALRKWYNHDPAKWELFKQKYFDELKTNNEEVKKFQNLIKDHETIMLIYSSSERDLNNAHALKEYLLNIR